MPRAVMALFGAMMLLASATPAHAAEGRVALVVGGAAYEDVPGSPHAVIVTGKLGSRNLFRVASAGGMQPGETFRDCAQCPQMVVVPSGSFTMGSPASEEGRIDDEGPQYRATIPAPFAVGRYEVTFAQWDACVSDGGCGGYLPRDEGWGQGDQPVINVGWDDIHDYVRWLSGKTGKPYRLLTEAE